jgi:adenylyltransferase/sulfurtransferase
MSTLKIPTPLRPYTNGTAEINVQGANVAEVMQSLVAQYPALKQHLYSGDELRPFVNIFIGQDNIKDLQGLETTVAENALLRIIPSIAGGAG